MSNRGIAHAAPLALAPVEFFVRGLRCLREYYRQPRNAMIRESCYQQDAGWFVRGDGVVTRRAKKGSPLAALRVCLPDEDIETIVLCLDVQDSICQVCEDLALCFTDSNIKC